MVRLPLFSAFVAIALLSAAADGQNTTPTLQLPAPSPTPVPTTPAPSPTTSFPRDAPFFPGTPSATPTPVPPSTPVVTPTPRATATPAPIRTPRAAATPRSTPSDAKTPSPEPTPSAAPWPEPTATPPATAVPAPTPTRTAVLPEQGDAAPIWPWLVGAAAALALLAVGWSALRRRGAPDEESVAQTPVFQPPVFQPLTLPIARIGLAVRPTRAGINMLSATVDTEVTLTNVGDAPAHDIRAELRLFSLTNDQSPVLDVFYAEPITRPSTPPFTLQPGEERRFRVVAALAHADIHPITAGGRPMFVPLLALSARYRDGDAARGMAQAFAVGVERVDSAKLAPFWLDAPARSYDQVAARAHGAVRETTVA